MKALGLPSGADDRPVRNQLGDAPTWVYPATSRYATTAVVVEGDVRCLGRRLVPLVDDAPALGHRVVSGDRLDTISGGELGTAELWWRIADANHGIDPVALTETPGRVLRVAPANGSVPIAGVALSSGGESDG